MELIFLGTSSMKPTRDRNQSAVVLKYKDEGILFDCGEGTQRQLIISGIPPTYLRRILISHWHGDHVYGLPGFIQTLNSMEFKGTLDIYGPKGSSKNFKMLSEIFNIKPDFELSVEDVGQGVFFTGKNYSLEALPLKHSIPCNAYAFVENDRRKIRMDLVKKLGIPIGPLIGKLQRGMAIEFKGIKINPDDVSYLVKGKKIAYLTDTLLTKNCYEIAANADALICEASFDSSLKEKAAEYMHLTALEAGQIASKSNVKKLLLFHYSARYKDLGVIEDDAKTAFSNITVAKDFTRIEL